MRSYQKRLGSGFSSPKLCSEAFPIKASVMVSSFANDYPVLRTAALKLIRKKRGDFIPSCREWFVIKKAEMSDLGQRATRRVAYRLLPFVFLIYIVNYIDRVNVSFANLRMSADLGFSDRVYGLGVGMFYISSELLTCCHEKLLRSGVSSSACRISSAS
jgi:hypothetical protein